MALLRDPQWVPVPPRCVVVFGQVLKVFGTEEPFVAGLG